MKLTIIPGNGVVIVDGRRFENVPMASIGADVHAVQWFGASGEIEFANSESGKPENEKIDSIDSFGEVLKYCEAIRAEQDAPHPLSIDELKLQKNDEINRARLAANQTAFEHGGKLVACDLLSRSDIDAIAIHVARKGAFPDGFPGAWKAIDNSYVMLPDMAAWDALYASMTAQGTANFNHAQALKAQLKDAKTKEEINAIKW